MVDSAEHHPDYREAGCFPKCQEKALAPSTSSRDGCSLFPGRQLHVRDVAQNCGGSIMKFPRRTFLHLAVGAAALPAVPRIARTQAYPSRPVRIVVGFPGGRAGDVPIFATVNV